MSADIYSSHDVVKTTLAVLFIGVFITASFWILRPILPSMAWAAMLVTATWPFLLWLQQRLGGSRTIAVIVMVVLILLIVIVPVSLAVLAIMEKIDVVALRAKELAAVGPPPPPECEEGFPSWSQNCRCLDTVDHPQQRCPRRPTYPVCPKGSGVVPDPRRKFRNLDLSVYSNAPHFGDPLR